MKTRKVPMVEPQVDDFCFMLAQIIARLQKEQGIPEERETGSASFVADPFGQTSKPAGKIQAKEARE